MNEQKKTVLWMCLSAFLPATLLCFAVVPLYLALASDVAYAGGFLCEFVYHLTKVLDPIRFALCFSVIGYASFRFPGRSRTTLYLIFIGASVYENLANFLMDALRGGLADAADLLLVDAVYVGMDMLVFLAFWLILRHWDGKRAANLDAVTRASRYTDKLPEGAPVIREADLRLVPDRKNPLQMTLVGAAIVITAFLILNGLIYDLAIGMPTSAAEWGQVTWFYSSLLVAGFLVYLGQIFFTRKLHSLFKD